jgi:hypothetical protein
VSAGDTVQVPVKFAVAEQGAERSFSAAQPNGEALPSWVTVSAETGAVSATPPAGFSGTLKVVVVALDANGQSAEVTVEINVAK